MVIYSPPIKINLAVTLIVIFLLSTTFHLPSVFLKSIRSNFPLLILNVFFNSSTLIGFLSLSLDLLEIKKSPIAFLPFGSTQENYRGRLSFKATRKCRCFLFPRTYNYIITIPLVVQYPLFHPSRASCLLSYAPILVPQ